MRVFQLQLWMYLILIIYTSTHNTVNALLTPLVIGGQDPGYCETYGSSIDSNAFDNGSGQTSESKLLVAGRTNSGTLLSTGSSACYSYSVPFIRLYDLTSSTPSILKQMYFTNQLTTGAGTGNPRFITSAKFPQFENLLVGTISNQKDSNICLLVIEIFSGSNKIDNVLLTLNLVDLSVVKSYGIVQYTLNINNFPRRNDISFKLLNGNYRIFWISSFERSLNKFNPQSIDFAQDSYNRVELVQTTNLQNVFGATALLVVDTNVLIGGTIKTTVNYGYRFLPLFMHADINLTVRNGFSYIYNAFNIEALTLYTDTVVGYSSSIDNYEAYSQESQIYTNYHFILYYGLYPVKTGCSHTVILRMIYFQNQLNQYMYYRVIALLPFNAENSIYAVFIMTNLKDMSLNSLEIGGQYQNILHTVNFNIKMFCNNGQTYTIMNNNVVNYTSDMASLGFTEKINQFGRIHEPAGVLMNELIGIHPFKSKDFYYISSCYKIRQDLSHNEDGQVFSTYSAYTMLNNNYKAIVIQSTITSTNQYSTWVASYSGNNYDNPGIYLNHPTIQSDFGPPCNLFATNQAVTSNVASLDLKYTLNQGQITLVNLNNQFTTTNQVGCPLLFTATYPNPPVSTSQPYITLDSVNQLHLLNTVMPGGSFEFTSTYSVTGTSQYSGQSAQVSITFSVGCYYEASISTITTGSISALYSKISSNNQYSRIIVVPLANPLDSATSIFQLRLSQLGISFPTNISQCKASIIKMCADALCDVVISSGPVSFDVVSITRTPSYLPDPLITIDRTQTALYKEIFIFASTLNLQIQTSLMPMVVTVCNSNMTLVAESVPATLNQKLANPSSSIVTVQISTLYRLATTNQFWTTQECFGGYTLCDETSCQQENKYTNVLYISNPQLITGTLNIYLSQPLSPVNAFVGIMQPDRSYLKIPVYVEICGYDANAGQSLTTTVQNINTNIMLNQGVLILVNLLQVFVTTNMQGCPVTYTATFPPPANLPYVYYDTQTQYHLVNTVMPAGLFEYSSSYQVTATTLSGFTSIIPVTFSVGCFQEQQINYLMTGNIAVPFSKQSPNPNYSIIIVIPQHDPLNSNTFSQSIRLSQVGITFPTNVALCKASIIKMCADPQCETIILSGPVIFDTESATRTPTYLPDPIIVIDRTVTTLYKEFYIRASTLNPSVFTILPPMVVAVCNTNMTLVAQPGAPLLIFKNPIPISTVVTVPILALFELANPSSIWTIQECFGGYTLCDETACQQESKFANVITLQNPNLSSGTIQIQLNTPMSLLKAFVGIMQPDKTYLKIPIEIEICWFVANSGQSVISTIPTFTAFYTLNTGLTNIFHLLTVFVTSNMDGCPPLIFTAVYPPPPPNKDNPYVITDPDTKYQIVDTQMPTGLYDFNFTYQVTATSQYSNLSATIPVAISIGCYNEQIINFNFTGKITVPHVKQVVNSTYSYIFIIPQADPLNISTNIYQANFSQLGLEYSTNVPLCNASLIKMCSDSLCNNQIITGPISFKENSTIRSPTNFPDPVLMVDRTQKIFNQQIFIQALNQNSSVSTTLLPALVIICNDNMTLVAEKPSESLTQFLPVPSDKTVTVPVKNLFKLATINELWTIEECFGGYTLCNDTACYLEKVYKDILTISDTNSTNGTLSINLSAPIPPFNAFVGIMQPNRTFLKIPIKLEVCGYEDIKPVSSMFIATKKNLTTPTTDFQIELSKLFNNSSPNNSCPIIRYTLKTSNGSKIDLDANSSSYAKLNLTHLIITSEIPKIMNFSIMAETFNTKQGWANFDINLTTYVPPPKPSVNQSPTIVGLLTTLNIQVESPPGDPFEYKSPIATDNEKDKIIMTFTSDLISKSFFSVIQNADDSFTVKVDKTLVTQKSAGTFPLKIVVDDQKAIMKSNYAISIVITVAEPKPEPKPVDPPKDNATAAVKTPAAEPAVATESAAAQESTKLKEEPEVVNKPVPPPVPPIVVTRAMDGTIPPRQNMPIEVVTYSNPEDLFIRTEPTIRTITMGKKGELGMQFSNDMVWPDEWQEKFKTDQVTLASEKNGTTTKANRRLAKISGAKFYYKRPTQNSDEEIDPNQVLISDIKGGQVQFKIQFKNPELVSLSSQSAEDNIIIKFDKTFVMNDVTGSSLVFDGGVNNENSIDMYLPVQTQIVENSAETKNLETASESTQTATSIVMVAQFGLTYAAQASLNAFWSLINSQCNLAYLPIMTVQNPGQVNFYLDTLVAIVSFDPIPIDVIYKAFDMWNFQWTAEPPERSAFERIGMDRIFINTLGSCVLPITYFSGAQALVYFLEFIFQYYKPGYKLKKLHSFFKIDGPIRPFVILFFLETYIDLLIGALINTENNYLFDTPANWGVNGYLTISDQFTVILGNIFLICCLLFPFLVFWVHYRKSKSVWMNTGDEIYFDRIYSCLYEDFKTNSGIFHYYTVFMLRRIFFVYICFKWYQPEYTFFQVMANVQISFIFVLYMVKFRPFLDEEMNKLQIINEYVFVVITYHQLLFTDFVDDASSKNLMGWSFVLCSLGNMIWPNGYLVVVNLIPSVVVLFTRKKVNIKKQEQMGNYQQIMEQKRKELLMKYNIQLKQKEKELDQDIFMPRKNQILPEPEFVKPFYDKRADKKAIMKLVHGENPHRSILGPIVIENMVGKKCIKLITELDVVKEVTIDFSLSNQTSDLGNIAQIQKGISLYEVTINSRTSSDNEEFYNFEMQEKQSGNSLRFGYNNSDNEEFYNFEMQEKQCGNSLRFGYNNQSSSQSSLSNEQYNFGNEIQTEQMATTQNNQVGRKSMRDLIN